MILTEQKSSAVLISVFFFILTMLYQLLCMQQFPVIGVYFSETYMDVVFLLRFINTGQQGGGFVTTEIWEIYIDLKLAAHYNIKELRNQFECHFCHC